MKSLYVGPSGKRFTKDQLKAIHAGRFDFSSQWHLSHTPKHVPIAVAKKNRFVVPAVLAAGASLAPAATAAVAEAGAGASLAPAAAGAGGAGLSLGGGAIGTGIGSSLRGAGSQDITVTQPNVPEMTMDESGQLQAKGPSNVLPQKPFLQRKPGDYLESGASYVAGKALEVGLPAAQLGASVAGAEFGNLLEGMSELGQPRVLSNNELIMERYGANFYSRGKDGHKDNYDIDVDKLRKVLKKQYPKADVDAKIKLLPENKYIETALKDNPGREKEALMSNGFYSPVKDTAYLEKGDKLNTVRALIHELVHDMANEGVEDYMLNEGYADYVAYNIMTEELGVPRNVARATIGYPDDMKRVDRLVRKYGREDVDKAFLKEHTLSYLDSKTPLLALNT